MARPVRCRRICYEPEYRGFSSEGIASAETITLTVDEYECIRLMDLEKCTQEQCAVKMDISRTTVAEIYSLAREKIAKAIVYGMPLIISGGNYRICGGDYESDSKSPCLATINLDNKKGSNTMRIAVTYENGQIFQHFGHTEQFKIYDVENNEIKSSQVVDTNGSGHGALAGFLTANEVDTLICGGIGGGAQAALAEARIKLYGGVSGNADAAVNALIGGQLDFNLDVHCDHHDHEHGGEAHTCGDHGCGHGSCHH